MSHINNLLQAYETLRHEHTALKQKLESKTEALMILNRELCECRQESSQYKLMSEQLRERCNIIKNQQDQSSKMDYSLRRGRNKDKDQNLIQFVCELKEQNKQLESEAEALRFKLKDSKDDITLLRSQLARQRVGVTDEGLNSRVFTIHEREELINQLEVLREKFNRCEKDLKQVLDEKEELVVERDVYRHKIDRLNTELNYILRGDQRRIVDVDALLMENKYLRQHMAQLEQEKHQAVVTVNKYKQTLEKRRNRGILKGESARDGRFIINQKHVEELLVRAGSNVRVDPDTQSLPYKDLHQLASALYENLNDKSIALAHQKKTNKILGTRVAELEKKLRTLETAGFWSIPGSRVYQRPGLGDVDVMADVSPVLAPAPSSHSPEPCLETVVERLREADLLPPGYGEGGSGGDDTDLLPPRYGEVGSGGNGKVEEELSHVVCVEGKDERECIESVFPSSPTTSSHSTSSPTPPSSPLQPPSSPLQPPFSPLQPPSSPLQPPSSPHQPPTSPHQPPSSPHQPTTSPHQTAT